MSDFEYFLSLDGPPNFNSSNINILSSRRPIWSHIARIEDINGYSVADSWRH